MDRKLWTIEEAAEILSISRSMLYSLVQTKSIACFRIGSPSARGTIRFNQSHLNEFLESTECEVVNGLSGVRSGTKLQLRHL